MKLTVIGMWGGFPKKDGPCSGYLIQQNGYSLLLDCGSGVLIKLQEFINLNEIHDVVLSHYHYDHSSDVGAFMFSRLVNSQLGRVKKPLTIYGPDDPIKKEEFSSVPKSQFQSISPASTLEIGPFQLSFIKTDHPVECYAMKIQCDDKTIVYTADTSYFEELVSFAKDVDLLIAECSLYEGMDGQQSGHMNAKDVGILVNKAKPKQTLLTHLPHYGHLNDLLESAKGYTEGKIGLAEVGLSVEV